MAVFQQAHQEGLVVHGGGLQLGLCFGLRFGPGRGSSAQSLGFLLGSGDG